MFRLHRHKQEKSGERIDFKFSHFHALQVFIRDTGESTIHGILFLSLSLAADFSISRFRCLSFWKLGSFCLFSETLPTCLDVEKTGKLRILRI